MTPGFSAPQGPKFFFIAVLFTAMAPWYVLPEKFRDTSMAGPLGGCYRQVRQRPPPELETSMAGPLGVLPAGSAAATTGVGDVDGGPLGGATGRSGSGHHWSWRHRWWAPWGCCR
jgi:hypothetical protein